MAAVTAVGGVGHRSTTVDRVGAVRGRLVGLCSGSRRNLSSVFTEHHRRAGLICRQLEFVVVLVLASIVHVCLLRE
jgi:hypothetical protein